ncbi:unnamed protein product [Paramecium pentaurelia]|uniref:Uncharacterized protein n=1 Tax=Paramecium pentaurelia TaxID=43138 RepID=A0A8S1WE99_9CILI|nr:unnamed protein product [Paramecium pentaurelia]
MSKFYIQEGSILTQNRKKKVFKNVINQQNQSKLLQSHILIQTSKSQGYMQQQNSFQYQQGRSKYNRNIINSSLLQDIGNIDLEIQKMSEEYNTTINQTQIMNRSFNLKVIVCQQNQTDLSKQDFKISQINKIKNSNINHQKLKISNKFNESSYSKLAESMKNYSNLKNMVEVKIIDIPQNNILKTKKLLSVNNSQNIEKTINPLGKKLPQKLNSERNKVSLMKPILKQTSYHTQDFSFNQINMIPNVSMKLDNIHNEIKSIIKDDNKLEKAVKIYNTLKQLIQQHSIFQQRVNSQKEYKNRITQ